MGIDAALITGGGLLKDQTKKADDHSKPTAAVKESKTKSEKAGPSVFSCASYEGAREIGLGPAYVMVNRPR